MRRGRDLLDGDLGRRLRGGHVARLHRGVALGLRAHHAAVVEADCTQPGPLAVMGHVISILLGRGEGRNQHTAGEGRGVRIRTGSGRKSQN